MKVFVLVLDCHISCGPETLMQTLMRIYIHVRTYLLRTKQCTRILFLGIKKANFN
jgi:hypothetical protein